MIYDVMDRSKWREMIRGTGVTEALTVTPRAEYDLSVSGAGSPMSTLNELVICFPSISEYSVAPSTYCWPVTRQLSQCVSVLS